jgi:hypothetical protein
VHWDVTFPVVFLSVPLPNASILECQSSAEIICSLLAFPDCAMSSGLLAP